MCGRYVLGSQPERIQDRFRLREISPKLNTPNYNISPGTYAPVITNRHPQSLQMFQFGLTPHWSKKPMYLFNARSEGDFNQENSVDYQGDKGIAQKPAFRKAIQSQRCLVIADAFVEGTTKDKLDKPYLIYLKNKVRPFAFAGIWDEWVNPVSGEILSSFSIITTTANALLQKIPHHRSPVILTPKAESIWLSDNALPEVLNLLSPYPADKMNAYPIDPQIKNPRNNSRELMEAIGERLMQE